MHNYKEIVLILALLDNNISTLTMSAFSLPMTSAETSWIEAANSLVVATSCLQDIIIRLDLSIPCLTKPAFLKTITNDQKMSKKIASSMKLDKSNLEHLRIHKYVNLTQSPVPTATLSDLPLNL